MRKKLTKGISLLVALVFCMTLIPAGILTASAATVYEENFTNYTAAKLSDCTQYSGSTHVPTGWGHSNLTKTGLHMYSGSDSTYGNTVIMETESTASYELMLTNTSGYTENWDTITLSMIIKKHDTSVDTIIRPYRTKATGDTNNQYWNLLTLNTSGKILYGTTEVGTYETGEWYRITATLDMTGKKGAAKIGYIGVTKLSNNSKVCESDTVTIEGGRDNTASGTPQLYIIQSKGASSGSAKAEIACVKAYAGAALAADKPSATVTPDPDPDPDPEPEDTIITDPANAAVQDAAGVYYDFEGYDVTRDYAVANDTVSTGPSGVTTSNENQTGTYIYSGKDENYGETVVLENTTTDKQLAIQPRGTVEDVVTVKTAIKPYDLNGTSYITIYRDKATGDTNDNLWQVLKFANGEISIAKTGTKFGTYEINKWYEVSITLNTSNMTSATDTNLEIVISDTNGNMLFKTSSTIKAHRTNTASGTTFYPHIYHLANTAGTASKAEIGYVALYGGMKPDKITVQHTFNDSSVWTVSGANLTSAENGGSSFLMSEGGTASSSDFSFVGDTANKALKIATQGAGIHRARLRPVSDILGSNTDKVQISMRIKGEGSEFDAKKVQFMDGSTVRDLVVFGSDTSVSLVDGDTPVWENDVWYDVTLDVNNSTGDVQASVTSENGFFASESINVKDTFTNTIGQVELYFGVYETTQNPPPTTVHYSYLDDYTIRKKTTLRVTDINPVPGYEKASIGANPVVSFSGVISDASLSDYVKLYDASGAQVDATVSRVNGKQVKIVPEDKLDENASYTVFVSNGIKELDGTQLANAYKYTFTTGDAVTVSDVTFDGAEAVIAGANKATVTVDFNDGENHDAVLIYAVYDNTTKKLIKVAADEEKNFTGKKVLAATVDLTGDTAVSGYTAIAYLFNGFSTLKPLIGATPLTPAN